MPPVNGDSVGFTGRQIGYDHVFLVPGNQFADWNASGPGLHFNHLVVDSIVLGRPHLRGRWHGLWVEVTGGLIINGINDSLGRQDEPKPRNNCGSRVEIHGDSQKNHRPTRWPDNRA